MVDNLLWETPTYLHWVICVGILFGEQFPTQWSFQHLDKVILKLQLSSHTRKPLWNVERATVIVKINLCKTNYWQSLIRNSEESCKRWEGDQDGAAFTINHSIVETSALACWVAVKSLPCQSDARVDKIVRDESMCRSFPYELIKKCCNYIVVTYC